MSLNRSEQLVFDYLQTQPDELRHWKNVVLGAAKRSPTLHLAANHLDHELWDYFRERAEVTEPFRSAVRHQGPTRTSMKNLAELLLRLWAPAPPPTKSFPRAEDFC
jgi:hypothetical protein